MSKLKIIVGFLVVLISQGNVFAETLALATDNSQPATLAEPIDSKVWPALPSESLNDIARLFYPKNVVLQQQFINQVLILNANKLPNLNPAAVFNKPTMLLIPAHQLLHKKPPAAKSIAKPNVDAPTKYRLQISYSLEEMVENIPIKLLQDYEVLVTKNEQLKQQLIVLKEKIIFLEKKLNGLKLIWEKTILAPVAGRPADNNASTTQQAASETKQAAIELPVRSTAATNAMPNINADSKVLSKKTFKNLDALPTQPAATQQASTWIDYLNTDIVKLALVLGLLGIISAVAFKKYRQYMFAKMSFVATKMHTSIQESMIDFGSYLKPKLPEIESPEMKLQAEAAKEVEARLDSTLAEAKLLMSVNRHQDAIAHLKLTIEAQPKACINHWLYLLEIYRKLNLKDEFESHAKGLHQIYNVMTPVWYETKVAMVVPQSLEEFPHIMEKLYTMWPGDLATVYLRGLILDNRGGERVGFGKEVLAEILMLIELLDIHKG